VPHYEAPVKLAYSAKNRSASIRIPFVNSEKARRIETRFPDPGANPYLCFAALMMAGLDGIQNKIHPGDPADKNLYDLPPEEDALIPTVCSSLDEALAALDKDREFLTRGGVFSNDFIDSFIALKKEEVNRLRVEVHRSSSRCTTPSDLRIGAGQRAGRPMRYKGTGLGPSFFPALVCVWPGRP
jgi:glutamine synthetase